MRRAGLLAAALALAAVPAVPAGVAPELAAHAGAPPTAAVATASATAAPGAAATAATAAAALARAEARLAASDIAGAAGNVEAQVGAVQAYEAGLALLRDGVAGAHGEARSISRDLAARDGEVKRLVAALAGAAARPPGIGGTGAAAGELHPGGPLAAARAAAMLERAAPALRAEATALGRRLADLAAARRLHEEGEDELAAGLARLAAARDALVAARPPVGGLPPSPPDAELAALMRRSDTLTEFAAAVEGMAVTKSTRGPAPAAVAGELPSDAVSGDAVPGDAVPGDAVPGDAVPSDPVPGDAVRGVAGAEPPRPAPEVVATAVAAAAAAIGRAASDAASDAAPRATPDAAPMIEPPVVGAMLRGYLDEDGAGVRRPGITFAAAPLAVVTAPVAGVVRYAGPFLDYGYVAILEPARGTLVIVAGLGALHVGTGESVSAGGLLGFLGGRALDAQEYLMLAGTRNPASGAETLYMELRHDGAPVDPGPWLAAARYLAGEERAGNE